MTTSDEAVAQIRTWLTDGVLRDLHLANLLWENVQQTSGNPRAAFGAHSDQFPGQRGYVVVHRDYQQAKSEV